ncbi:single-stranded DNA-binding domain protein [Mycobacterium kansasii]|uniref:Single-stranded DNA-binding protein n=1 Tax=Mycobacterium kansasii TaxID=1768 RepID=A0A1V3WWQ2_MYCKA|nr:single-stranded DNA-binding domain protein [Mycobacterium kansasii]
MAGDTTITVVGNLTADPELRFTPSGAAVANFTVASTPRIYDRQTGEWKDGEALFLRCNIWREAAENVAESLTRGARVIVTGRLKQRSFETREGEKRTVVEVEVDEIGPSLRYATAKVNKASRSGGGGGFGGGGGSRPATPPASGTPGPGDDPWGSALPRAHSAVTTSRRSDRHHVPSLSYGKKETHGQVQQATPGSGKAGQGAQMRLLREEGSEDRLQGHRAAADLYQRARQDPGAPGHRQLCSAPTRHRNRGEECP